MKKYLQKTIRMKGYKRPCRIVCEIRDTDGYIAITGEVRCWNGGMIMGGCIHEEIAMYFPKVRPFLNLHLVDRENCTPMHFYENALFLIANGNLCAAQNLLHCTDEELVSLKSLCDYGLHKTRHDGYDGKPWYTCDENAKRVFANAVDRLGIKERIKAHFDDFYKFVESLP